MKKHELLKVFGTLFLTSFFQLAFSQSEVKTITVCEGEKMWIQCANYEIVEVVEVFWGRDGEEKCAEIPTGLVGDEMCETNAENALQKVNGQCGGEQACEVVASNLFFDDNSCRNVYKYLRVKYKCISDGDSGGLH